MEKVLRKTLNYYCDESTHIENDHKDYMVIGYISVPSHRILEYKIKLKKIRENHYMFNEIKWSHVSSSKSHFYDDLIDFFFSSDLTFRAIIVDKRKIKNDEFGQDFDTFYYKMYYQLLAHKLDMSCEYNIYLDIKDKLAKYKISKLKDILQTQYGVIKNIQSIPSQQSTFIQICDLFIGAIAYNLNSKSFNVTSKVNIMTRIQERAGICFKYSTPFVESKINLFHIKL